MNYIKKNSVEICYKIENIVYLIFVISIILVAKGFQKLKKFAFTPFLLIQLFAIIIGWPFVEDADLYTKLFGLLILSFSVFALVLALLPINRKKFY